MDGAFNDLLLTLVPGTRPEEVGRSLDQLLRPYGGLGVYERREQLSHRYLEAEMTQLRQMALIYPLVFSGVAAFLLQLVMARLISAEREEIGLLKAFGLQ